MMKYLNILRMHDVKRTKARDNILHVCFTYVNEYKNLIQGQCEAVEIIKFAIFISKYDKTYEKYVVLNLL